VTPLVDLLAAYRITRLVTTDVLTEDLREAYCRWLERDVDPEESTERKLVTLVHCAWCASPYVTVGVLAARRLAPRLWGPVALVLASSAVIGLLAQADATLAAAAKR
jgi:hypothetical protein